MNECAEGFIFNFASNKSGLAGRVHKTRPRSRQVLFHKIPGEELSVSIHEKIICPGLMVGHSHLRSKAVWGVIPLIGVGEMKMIDVGIGVRAFAEKERFAVGGKRG